MIKKVFFCCALLFNIPLAAQKKLNFNRMIQVSVTPGLGTNGFHPGGFNNYFSFNLTSGYSASNYLLEIGIVSNLNEHETHGLQIAGLSNFTGANAFAGMQKKQRDELIKSGFETNLSGLQFSGVTNVVLNNVFGGQTSGGMNFTQGALEGFQLAGISNVVYKYSFGLQIAGLWNASTESMNGVQVAGLFNYTSGGLFGMQLGAFNMAGFTEGRNSFNNKDLTGIQLGILNKARRMNGFQVGLVNIAGRMQGTQIGLINIYRHGTTTGTRDGTSVGLINIGDFNYLAIYTNEIFVTNLEIATGNSKNRRIKSDVKSVYVSNTLIYSNDPGFLHNEGSKEAGQWAFGYGLHKFFYTRNSSPGMNQFRFIAFGADGIHMNHEMGKLTKELSLDLRPKFSAGTRLHPKWSGIYVFGSLTYNFYLSERVYNIAPDFLKAYTSVNKQSLEMWPGFSAGIQIH